MSQSDTQNTVNTSPPRLGEIGRAVARNIRGLTDQLELPTFASSLADATQARTAGQSAPAETGRSASTAPPTITTIRPGGRTLSAHSDTPTPALGAAADADPNLMLMAAAQATPGAPAPIVQQQYPAGQQPVPGTPPVAGPGGAPAITGAGTRRDPLILPYGTSQADAEAVAAATARARATSDLKPLELKEYPKPEKSDRNGVVSWATTTPPTGRDLDRFVEEARNRKAGYVTFEVDPGHVQQYDEIVARLDEAGIQPVVRLQDPYGDLPPEEVREIVKDLRSQGVRYFQLFDGGNVASDTPDNRVDVRDYAQRWLAAAEAVVEGGGLPGIGALAPGGDFDDRGFMRQLLSIVKERGGTDVLGQAWVALRGEQPGATAGPSDVRNLADRAEWYDRISRHTLGRSMPIMATLDPAGRGERLANDPGSTPAHASADQSEKELKDLKRKLPALFGVNRGTVESARP